MLTRLDESTPASVRTQIDKLCEGIEAICTILDGIPPGHPDEADCCAAIDVLYLDADAMLSEWERDVEIEPRPNACCATCAEFSGANGCDGSWHCTAERQAETRKTA